MSYTLHWTTEAARTLNQNLEYLEDEWDNQVVNNFLDRVEEVLENIKTNPQMYRCTDPRTPSVNVPSINGSSCSTR